MGCNIFGVVYIIEGYLPLMWTMGLVIPNKEKMCVVLGSASTKYNFNRMAKGITRPCSKVYILSLVFYASRFIIDFFFAGLITERGWETLASFVKESSKRRTSSLNFSGGKTIKEMEDDHCRWTFCSWAHLFLGNNGKSEDSYRK